MKPLSRGLGFLAWFLYAHFISLLVGAFFVAMVLFYGGSFVLHEVYEGEVFQALRELIFVLNFAMVFLYFVVGLFVATLKNDYGYFRFESYLEVIRRAFGKIFLLFFLLSVRTLWSS